MWQAFASTRKQAAVAAAAAWWSLAAGTSLHAEAPTLEQVRTIVHASCETCHSLGAGPGRVGPSLSGLLNGSAPRSSPDAVKDVIRHGRNNRMPAYGTLFSPAELESIVQYLRQLP